MKKTKQNREYEKRNVEEIIIKNREKKREIIIMMLMS